MSTILVLGVGNTLLSDEGVGIHALTRLQHRYPSLPDVRYLDGGTLSFTLAGPLQDADNLIVFDAANFDAKPGAVRCMVDDRMDGFLNTAKHSAHEVGLLDLMDIARLTNTLPVRRALIAIQPEIIDWGSTLSDSVDRAVNRAVKLAYALIKQWAGTTISPGNTTGRGGSPPASAEVTAERVSAGNQKMLYE